MRRPVGRYSGVLVSCLLLAATASAERGKPRVPPRAAGEEEAAPGKGARPESRPVGSSPVEEAVIDLDADEGEEAPSSSDPKLDEPPPPSKPRAGDQKLSPLNPEPEEFPGGDTPAGPADLTKLLSDIATLRGRVAALTTSLFSSKLRVYVRTDGDDARIDQFNITLDEGVVFRAPARFLAEDSRAIYEHAVAPGNHVIGVEIQRHDARGPTYKTWQVTKFSVTVPDKELLEVDLRLEDDSDMAEDFPDDKDGEYELGVRLRARVTE